MAKNLVTEAQQYLSSRNKDKRRSQVLRIVAVLVVFVTIYTLILPAVTMSNEVECGMDEHIHDDGCWEMRMEAPQPELTCTVGSAGEIVVHTHDSYCYDSQGNLTCTLSEVEAHEHGPECYHEQRTLLCGEHQDLGHQHGASCYSYVRMDGSAELPEPAVPLASEINYICGMQAGEGAHSHREECYPEERMAEAQCGFEESADVLDEAGNVIQAGHHHTDECYMVRVQEKLVCGQEESDDVLDGEGNVIQQGHRHSGSCYLRGDELCFQYGCRQHESTGHQHTDACIAKMSEPEPSTSVDGQGEPWQKTLICLEEERQSGHVHTDDCYEINELFICRKQVLQVHSHDESCYGEGGAPVCGKLEVAAHQHTEGCFTTPEGDAQETKVLVCGQEEHTHVEQCYVKSAPKSEEIFYCGLNEHTHTHSDPDCYFESGALVCTLVEHSHNLTCMEEPVEVSDEPGESDKPESQRPKKGVMLEEYVFSYTENEAFDVTYIINGFATLDAGEDLPEETVSGDRQNLDNVPSAEPESDPIVEPEADPTVEPAAQIAEPTPAPSSEMLVEIMNQMVPLAAMPGKAHRLMNQFDGVSVEPWDGVSGSAQIDPSQMKCRVVMLEEDDPRYQAMAEMMDSAKEEEDGDSFLREIFMLVCTVDGMGLDLSDCAVDVIVTPKPALIMGASAGDGLEGGLEPGSILSVYSVNGCEQTIPLGDNTQDEQGESGIMTLSDVEMPLSEGPLDGEQGEGGQDGQPSTQSNEEGGQDGQPSAQSDEDGVVYGVDVNNLANPNFDVQYYAYLDRVIRGSSGTLPVIDTSRKNDGKETTAGNLPAMHKGGLLPANGKGTSVSPNNNSLAYLTVNADGTIKTNKELTEIYGTQNFEYQKAPGLKYVNIVLKNEKTEYALKEIWVLKDGKDPSSMDENDWTPHTYSLASRFTNRPQTAENNRDFILVEDGAVIRLIYETKKVTNNFPANFYDYDITTGYIYTEANPLKDSVKKVTSTQTNDKWYAWTWKRGININSNYSNDGRAKLAFGHSNGVAGSGLGDQKWNGSLLNTYNGGSGSKGYNGCTFGLASRLDNGIIMYSDGLDVPNLFNEDTANGKTIYQDGQYSLNFERVGDTYTLSSVENTTSAIDLTKFKNPGVYDGVQNSKTIWTNDFWPMDSASSWGTAGHDLKFGSSDLKANRVYFGAEKAENKTYSTSSSTIMPVSDDGKDHNSYFGMQYAVTFELTNNYVGPLEYYFFGDDDMWVFLDGELVCDIGGVHSSVGEYVNLWDYINKADLDKLEEDQTKTYTLTFYYTERGASGSTCWMQFTLPTVVGLNLEEILDKQKGSGTGSLSIEKELSGVENTHWFQFELELDYDKPDEEKEAFDNYDYILQNANGELIDMDKTEFSEGGYVADGSHFKIRAGDVLVIRNLPIGTTYRVTEVNTGGYHTNITTEVNGDIETVEDYVVVTGKIVGIDKDGHIVESVKGMTPEEIKELDVKGLRTKVKYTNVATYELPKTGGNTVAQWYTMAGLPLAAMFCVWYKKKSHGKGAEDGA